MKIQRLYSLVRQAIDDYEMIDDGDKIAVGVSGGKDSLVLLLILNGMRTFYPKKYELMAITCDIGFDGMDYSLITSWCKQMGIEHIIVKTGIAEIVFEKNSDKRPCSLCAKMRKGAINNKLAELGVNKIAYAHHKDDFIETAFMSLLYEGRFYSFPPKTELDRKELTVIRPLMYVPERSIANYAEEYALPICKNKCPVDGTTKRAYAKQLVRQIVEDCPEAKDRVMHAIETAGFEDWPQKHQ